MGTKPLAFIFFALVGSLGAATAMSACVGDDGTPLVSSNDGGMLEATTPPASLKANGTPCGGATECTSQQCSDGVCCDAKCDGVCEKCNLAGTVGTCSPVPDATDPDNECPTTPLDNDAGAPPDAGSDDGGDAGDAGVVDAGPVFTIPDGGVPAVSANQCAGHCNGKRACAYAGKEVTCGTSFCGNSTEQGRASCDGAGHCVYGVEECSAYACPDGSPGCKTSCASSTDCLSTYYCDGPTGVCKPKLTNGTSCTNVTQCQSGVCDSAAGVCCNSDCTSTPGGTCAKPNAIGTCTCSACNGAGGCALFYADRDHDGFGDAHGTVANGGAAYGCAVASGGAPPTGFVADHTDCLDSDAAVAASAHPGQALWYAAGYTDSTGQTSFDYDCSGSTEKETPEVGCGFANFHSYVIFPKESLVSQPDYYLPGYCTFDPNCTSANAQGGHSAGGSQGCTIDNDPGFQLTIPCGNTGSLYTCGTCSAAGGTAPLTSAGSKAQRCH